jgi:hypothetical protein
MLERNLAQGVALVTDFNPETFETTVSIRRLEHVSSLMRKAQPPMWPETILGKIDSSKLEIGKEIFKNTCLGCHDPKSANTSAGSAEFNYIDVGTDSAYYKGQVDLLAGSELFKEVLTPFLSRVKREAYQREGLNGTENFYEAGRLPTEWRRPQGNLIVAKPLFGAWATAPFLHNGSVLNIRELLTKPEERLTSFWVGSREYDSQNLGFKNEETWFGTKITVRCDKGCTGNGNQGHNFGTNLSESNKDALIEFLKSYNSTTEL